jgi:hypothetical protein
MVATGVAVAGEPVARFIGNTFGDAWEALGRAASPIPVPDSPAASLPFNAPGDTTSFGSSRVEEPPVARPGGLAEDPTGQEIAPPTEPPITPLPMGGNAPPIAVDDAVSTEEDAPISILPLENDQEPDGDAMLVRAIAPPGHGTAKMKGDAIITYRPEPDFGGEDSIIYTVLDSSGAAAEATIHILVSPVNDPPIAIDDDAVAQEDVPVTIAVLDNDSDVDDKALTVAADQAHHGSVEPNEDGTLTYTPEPDYHGEDSFSYRALDANAKSDPAKVTIVVGAVPDPVVNDDAATTSEGTPVTIDVLANDVEVDGLTLAVLDPSNGTVTGNADGTVTYVPNPGFTGKDSFFYTLSDGTSESLRARVEVTVTPVHSVREVTVTPLPSV